MKLAISHCVSTCALNLWLMRVSWNVSGAANNACRQKLCSHLCLPKQTYPGFSCACPNSNDRVRYSLDGRGLQCIVTGVPLRPGTVSSINTHCLLGAAHTSVQYHVHAYFVFLTRNFYFCTPPWWSSMVCASALVLSLNCLSLNVKIWCKGELELGRPQRWT